MGEIKVTSAGLGRASLGVHGRTQTCSRRSNNCSLRFRKTGGKGEDGGEDGKQTL